MTHLEWSGADTKDTNPFRYCGEYFDQESG